MTILSVELANAAIATGGTIYCKYLPTGETLHLKEQTFILGTLAESNIETLKPAYFFRRPGKSSLVLETCDLNKVKYLENVRHSGPR